MKLYRVRTRFLGKDLDNEAEMGLLVANSDKECYEIINKSWSYWDEYYEDDEYRERFYKQIMDEKGDWNDDYRGEFYDQKFAWECLGAISGSELIVLMDFNLIINPESTVAAVAV